MNERNATRLSPTPVVSTLAETELVGDSWALFPSQEETEALGSSGDQPEPRIWRTTQFGDFRILREIGRGGMGLVYEAEQVSLGRRVALKMLPPQTFRESQSRQRFLREARAAARLHHTNIVPVFGIGEHEATPYYVMQFIRGAGLDAVIRHLRSTRDGADCPTTRIEYDEPEHSAGSLFTAEIASSLRRGRFDRFGDDTAQGGPASGNPRVAVPPTSLGESGNDIARAQQCAWESTTPRSPAQTVESRWGPRSVRSYWAGVARIGVQVGSALEYAHEQGVRHRDIKPSNILLDVAGTAWVTDFGLAAADDQPDLTRTGDVLGTLRYLPPEAFEGKADSRADIYALGLTLYELLALRPAFVARDRAALVRLVTEAEPTRLRVLCPEVPRDLETIVHRAIARDPDQRYATAGELAEDLQRFLDDEPIRAQRASLRQRYARWARKHPGIAILSVLLAAVLTVATAGSLAAARRFRLQAEVQHRLAEDREFERQRALQSGARETIARREAERANTGLRTARDTLRHSLYGARTHLALAAFEASDMGRLRSVLDACRPLGDEPDLRGWEWEFLDSLTRQEDRTVLGHQAPVSNVAFSPDGRFVASSQVGGLVKLWDARTGDVRFTFPVGEAQGDLGPWSGAINGLAFRPDGRRIATAGADWVVRIWDTETGLLVRSIDTGRGSIMSLAYSPDGRRLAGAAATHTLRVWNADNGELLCTARGGHAGPVTGTAFSPDGQTLASCSNDQTIKIWNAESGEPLHVLQGHTDRVGGIAFSPDGRSLASAGGDGTIRIWDPRTGNPLVVRRHAHTAGINRVAYSPDGRKLVSCGDDQAVMLWDSESLEPLRIFRGHVAGIVAVAFNADNRTLASASSDRTVKLWKTDSPEQPRVLIDPTPRRYDGGATSLAFSPDGRTIVSGHGDSEYSIKFWDQAGRILRSYPANGFTAVSLEFSPDGQLLASAEGDVAVLRDVASWRTVHILEGHKSRVKCVAFRPNGRQVASASRDGTVRIWDVATGKVDHTLEGHTEAVPGVAYSPDGARLASADTNGNIIIWEASTGRVVRRMSSPYSHSCIAFSPDGSMIAAGSDRGPATLWDASTGEPLRELTGHLSSVMKLVFSRDGSRIASTGMDRVVKLWESSTGQELLTLSGHSRTVYDVAFSPDGRQLASASLDRTIRIWTAPVSIPRAVTSVPPRAPMTSDAGVPDDPKAGPPRRTAGATP